MPEGQDGIGVEADQDQVIKPKRSQTVDYLLTAAQDPSCCPVAVPGMSQPPPLEPPSWSCLLPGHVGQLATGDGGQPEEGAEEGTHDSGKGRLSRSPL